MQFFDDNQTEASRRLLDETHTFPCDFMVKVIGVAQEQFVQRVVLAVRRTQQLEQDPPFRYRHTPSGRHVAVTLEPRVNSAQEILAIYREIRRLDGVVMMM